MEIVEKLTDLTKQGRLIWKINPGNHLYLNLDKYKGRIGEFRITISRDYDYYSNIPIYHISISVANRNIYNRDYNRNHEESNGVKALIDEILYGNFGIY